MNRKGNTSSLAKARAALAAKRQQPEPVVQVEDIVQVEPVVQLEVTMTPHMRAVAAGGVVGHGPEPDPARCLWCRRDEWDGLAPKVEATDTDSPASGKFRGVGTLGQRQEYAANDLVMRRGPDGSMRPVERPNDNRDTERPHCQFPDHLGRYPERRTAGQSAFEKMMDSGNVEVPREQRVYLR